MDREILEILKRLENKIDNGLKRLETKIDQHTQILSKHTQILRALEHSLK